MILEASARLSRRPRSPSWVCWSLALASARSSAAATWASCSRSAATEAVSCSTCARAAVLVCCSPVSAFSTSLARAASALRSLSVALSWAARLAALARKSVLAVRSSASRLPSSLTCCCSSLSALSRPVRASARKNWPAVNTNKIKMITIKSCAKASTKPGQMSMLGRRERRLARAMMAGACEKRRRSPTVLGEGGNRAGEQPDLAAQLLHALCPALGDIFGQPGHVSLDIAKMGAQDIVLAEGVFGDRGQPGELRLQLRLVLGQLHHQRWPGLHVL